MLVVENVVNAIEVDLSGMLEIYGFPRGQIPFHIF